MNRRELVVLVYAGSGGVDPGALAVRRLVEVMDASIVNLLQHISVSKL